MAVEMSLEARIREWEERLARSADDHPPLTLTPAWWQERLFQYGAASRRKTGHRAAGDRAPGLLLFRSARVHSLQEFSILPEVPQGQVLRIHPFMRSFAELMSKLAVQEQPFQTRRQGFQVSWVRQ